MIPIFSSSAWQRDESAFVVSRALSTTTSPWIS